MTFGYAEITKTRAKRAIATFDSIRDKVDEMAPSYPVVFDMLRMMVHVADGDMLTINAEALNAVYWVSEYAYLARQPQEPEVSQEEKELLLENTVHAN